MMEPGTPDIQDFVVIEEDELDEYNPDVAPQSTEVIKAIRTWLQPTDYLAESSEFNKHLYNHVAGTGVWMQETDIYRTWHDSPLHGALWVKGIAGAGKSVWSAMLAEKLASTEKVPVLSFFFRQIVATNHHPQSLVRDWLAMVLNDSPALQARMKKHMDDSRTLESLTTNELWQDLIHAIISMPKVYLFVDALDEMDIDQQEFFTNLVNLGKRKPSSIKLLMTSRPLPRIEAYMRDPAILQMRLEQLKVDEDIAIYVGHRLDHQDKDVSVELQSAIKQAIGEKAQGSFLYARLMMDELLDHLQQMTADLESIRRSLTWLPSTLEDMYNGMLWDHSLRSCISQDLQFQILQCVTHSTRPLRLLELASMIDSQARNGQDGSRRSDTKAVVRAACGPLLEILEDETVSVIHHSFTEFLTDISRRQKPSTKDCPQFPVIDSAAAHKKIAITCLNYLSEALKEWTLPVELSANHSNRYNGAAPRRPVQPDLKLEKPFLFYASNNWYVHVRQSGSDDEDLFIELDGFMNPDNHIFKAWIDIVWANNRTIFSTVQPLHVSAWAGMLQYTRYMLLEKAESSNSLDSRNRTPLSYAAAKGFDEVVALLLGYVDDANLDCHNGLKPIHYASQGNHYKVVKLLLQAGVSPLTGKTRDPNRRCGNGPSSIGHTPLMYACHAGGLETVREMIPYLKPEDLTNALGWSAEAGKVDVVNLLLKSHEISVDRLDATPTALFQASAGRHHEAVRSLLKAGADPNRRCIPRDRNRSHSSYVDKVTGENLGLSPLHALCGAISHGRFGARPDEEVLTKCFTLLLDAGCDINLAEKNGKTPLHYSASRHSGNSKAYETLTMLLLQHGGDPKKCDSNGWTPLHFHKLHPNSDLLIKEFLSRGGDMCAIAKSDGRTPVHVMMENCYKVDISPLLPYVPDWNMQDNNGDTPLHIFLAKSFDADDSLKLLLDAGADLTIKNRKGEVPHMLVGDVSRGYSKPLLPVLVAAGADIESRDNSGMTILLRVLNSHTMYATKSLQSILDLGANIHAVDFDGNGCLHTQFKRFYSPLVVDFLVAAGANPLLTNHDGDNLLHVALDNYTGEYDKVESSLKTLLDLGVSPLAKNIQGRTPLHLICQRTSPPGYGFRHDPMDLILKSKVGETVNFMDNEGIRPIHLAATLSDQLVAKLIQYGADPLAETYERKNILHIAARAKKANVVGFILDHLKDTDVKDLINSIDTAGRSPLHHACRSGRPDTVDLLLQAGANPNLGDFYGYTPVHACAEFEQEKIFWRSNESFQHVTTFSSGILQNDTSRLYGRNANHNATRTDIWESNQIQGGHDRLREILQMLLRYGANPPAQRSSGNHSPFYYAVHRGCSEMVQELKVLMSEADLKTALEDQHVQTEFRSRILTQPWNTPVLNEDLAEDGDNIHLCNDLLLRRQYDSILKLQSMGVNFAPQRGRSSFLSTLAQNGYYELFEKLGNTIKEPGWINGLYSPRRDDKMAVLPYLVTACRSILPNLHMMKVIVEVFKADVNLQPQTIYGPDPLEKGPFAGSAALHILAEGGEWWKSKGIEYLLDHGADPNLKNEHGLTPLAITVNNDKLVQNYCRFHNAEMLLKHGADPNILDATMVSCISKAMHDVKLVRLLLEYGADITLGERPPLTSAITGLDPTGLKVILDSGADCNRKRVATPEESLNRNGSALSKDYDYYPIHLAASSRFNTRNTRSKAIDIINILLANGADVFLKYGDQDSVSEGGTILHEIFKWGGILQPFLEIPDLDLEHRDQHGNTLLLAAANSNAGTTAPTGFKPSYGPMSGEESAKLKAEETRGDPTACHTVFLSGGKLNVVNNAGDNALHMLTAVVPHNEDEHQRTFLAFMAAAPELIDMPNASGETPLHFALQRRKWWHVQTLLDAGASALRPDADGDTPLHHLASLICTSNGDKEWIAWFHKFLSLGVSINAKNNDGETPIFEFFKAESPYNRTTDKAIAHAHRRLLTIFYHAGADIFARNNEGQTLLHVIPKQAKGAFTMSKGTTVSDEAVECFRFLVELGIDPMLEDARQRTALDVAAACGKTEILNLFKRESGKSVPIVGKMPLPPPPPPTFVHSKPAVVVKDYSEDEWAL